MNDPIDLLQIKIEKAKSALPIETQNAIATVDWKASILELRTKKGYTFEQLGDLEIETELLLCGLLSTRDYPEELEKRMGISKMAANELVVEMNNLVFKKIKEELIKNTDRKKTFQQRENTPSQLSQEESTPEEEKTNDTLAFQEAGIQIIRDEKLPVPDLPVVPSAQLMQAGKIEPAEKIHSLLAQKLSGSIQTPTVRTEHTLENISKSAIPSTPQPTTPKVPKIDPYRELPE